MSNSIYPNRQVYANKKDLLKTVNKNNLRPYVRVKFNGEAVGLLIPVDWDQWLDNLLFTASYEYPTDDRAGCSIFNEILEGFIFPEANLPMLDLNELSEEEILRIFNENGLSEKDLPWISRSQQVSTSDWNSQKIRSLKEVFDAWAAELPRTKRNYASAVRSIAQRGVIDFTQSLADISAQNQDLIVDLIQNIDEWKESTQQVKAAAWIEFSKFLNTLSNGVIRAARCTQNNEYRTYYLLPDQSKLSLRKQEVDTFLETFYEQHSKYALVAHLILLGMTLEKALSLLGNEIDNVSIPLTDDCKMILSKQLKTPDGLVFSTCSGKKINSSQVTDWITRIGKQAGCSIRVTPRILRNTAHVLEDQIPHYFQ